VGAVGYFLLTGSPVFDATSLVDLCRKHVDETPISPSERFATDVSSGLEDALLACLEKSRAKRAQTARDLAQLLDKCQTTSDSWSIDDSDAWWGRHERSVKGTPSTDSNSATAVLDRTIDSQNSG
jgi:serine/threonine protein kinase